MSQLRYSRTSSSYPVKDNSDFVKRIEISLIKQFSALFKLDTSSVRTESFPTGEFLPREHNKALLVLMEDVLDVELEFHFTLSEP